MVGTDGSEPAATALSWAAEEAERRGAVLEVVHAWLPPYPVLPTDLYTDYAPMQRAAEALVNASVERLRQDLPDLVDVGTSAPMGHPAPALLCAAAGAELLVVGSRGRGGSRALMLGSVSERCITRAPGSVAVVPEPEANIARGRVVVGVDGSPASEEALAWAAREATLRWARLHVVHAWMPHRGGPDASEETSRALLEEMVDGIGEARDGGPPDLLLQSVAGPAARALVQSAAHAELLVVGARGVGGVRGVLPSSVSLQCAHHAPCPTVVVRGAPARERVMATAARHAHEP